MGFFKYILMVFASIEIVYSIILAVVHPVFFGYDHRQVTFSNSPILPAEYGDMGIGLFCAIYEFWLGFIAFMFLYRYIAVCSPNSNYAIMMKSWPKICIVVFYFAYLVYTILCGFMWCQKNNIPDHVVRKLIDSYDDINATAPGYIVIAIIDKEGNFNVSGSMAVLDHYILAAMSMFIVVYCGVKIKIKMNEIQAIQVQKDYAKSLQIFYILVVQAGIPIIFYQIPGGLVVTDSLLEKEPLFGFYDKFWLINLMMPKLVDPLLTMFIIKEYRNALLGRIRCYTKTTVTDVTVGN